MRLGNPAAGRGRNPGVSVESPAETSTAAARFAAVGVERYELALRAGRMGTWYWDVAANRVDWDDQLPRVFGLEVGSSTAPLTATWRFCTRTTSKRPSPRSRTRWRLAVITTSSTGLSTPTAACTG